ncbi:amino acid permease [Rasamsonia emersonii CBS 393.64]|uniref:Amino acid permease n=1 Tax=Rasamsonia emersonii (strain ATCC 16479 / CBS 393.64 / IMI 116815) TaxID=1408163 RepID=A0A0F4YZA4_RASE3|nr:amino acid permease [Rasamsonia emersonii CBS 393.64]KKA22963.1 amino acid permease [Rasamsonia emersonii CBS 393.64]
MALAVPPCRTVLPSWETVPLPRRVIGVEIPVAALDIAMSTNTAEKDVKTVNDLDRHGHAPDVEIASVDDRPPEFSEEKDLRFAQFCPVPSQYNGLFLGSGRALANGGPAGAFIGYTITGILVSGVVISIAELSALVPLSGGIIRHAEYFVDPALSFAQGWNSIYSYLITIPAEIVAAAVIVQFWTTINNAVWITVFGALLFASNLFLVRIYGELEFTFATLKILLIVGMNIMALVITCGGGPNHEAYGFRFWHNPGPFVQYLGHGGSLGRFMGFWTTFSNAVYAYSGVETISMAAAETRAPRRNIPRAAKRIFWRVLIFYGTHSAGYRRVSSDDLLKSSGTAAESPFVIAAERAGIKAVPSIINFVVLTSAWSAGNSGLLNGSRTLYGLAREGHAPRVLKRTSRWGVPYLSVIAVGIFVALGYMSLSASAATVFTWLQDLTSSAALVGWIVICIVYLRFYYAMKKQGISRDDLPWKAPLQPYAAWTSFISIIILLLTGGYTTFIHGHWDTETFISAYLDIVIVLALYFGYKIANNTLIVPLSEAPIRKFIEIAQQQPDPPSTPKAGLKKLNFLWEWMNIRCTRGSNSRQT